MPTLRLYTDFVCPFCFIAEASTVPRLCREFGLELDWHGFELHPRTPPGGVPLSRLFPGRDLASMHEGTKRFAAGFGVTDFSPPNVLYNTRRALAIAEYAREAGKLAEYRSAAFDANFREGKSLESDDDLRSIATSVGLDAERALECSRDPLYLRRVDDKQEEARAAGVSGVPTFLFGRERVVGCQPYEVLAAAARRAGG